MNPIYHLEWIRAEQTMQKMVHILQRLNRLPHLPPCWPLSLDYIKAYDTQEEAAAAIEHARSWFAIPAGLLYWMMKKVPDPGFQEGQRAPKWFHQVLLEMSDKVTFDSLRLSDVFETHYTWNQVGVWLHNPEDKQSQPPVEFFLKAGVPVWYRWGKREDRQKGWNSSYPLIAPHPWELQDATTFITCPPPSNNDWNYSNDADPVQELEPGFPVVSAHEHVHTQSQSPPPPAQEKREMAQQAWNDFWARRDKKNETLRAKETQRQKQQRDSCQKHPPITSAPVYAWRIDSDKPSGYVRELVSFEDREEALIEEFRDSVRKYDPVANEWHCCDFWNDDSDTASDENDGNVQVSESDPSSEPLPTSTSASTIVSSPAAPPSMSVGMERTQSEVLRLLSLHFGFVPPLPLPTSFRPGFTADADRLSLIAVLGLDADKINNNFFALPLGKICMNFLRTFSSKDEESMPDPELWDLSENNRQYVVFSKRFSTIRTVSSSNQTWFMFDFGLSRTVPWNLAVRSGAAALYICCLDDQLDEEDIVLDLVREGIEFHTLQPLDDLSAAPRDRIASTYVPYRMSEHEFDNQDYEFWKKQVNHIMTLRRGRAAIIRGGFARRIGLSYMSSWEGARGPSGIYDNPEHMFIARDAAGVEYVDDCLTENELGALCGLYLTFTGSGEQIGKQSWYPLAPVFDGSGEDMGWWMDRAEKLWRHINTIIKHEVIDDKLQLPLNVRNWRNILRGYADGRRAVKKAKKWSIGVLNDHLGSL
ncbi:hypothetical protein NP233_g11535 [Leucocoprinus birnbaumii]|uniref:Uncharacterized protein n=1 Tax=Leucocoprinus birnbaumii TaxID=56174 RepID=A0AAD5VHA9_9AGAR|nr:hypothetical protein NP233_g11535 [Leucocoprinus birnbaumii]